MNRLSKYEVGECEYICISSKIKLYNMFNVPIYINSYNISCTPYSYNKLNNY